MQRAGRARAPIQCGVRNPCPRLFLGIAVVESIRPRMIGVAVAVCLFAVGMAAFLNYFKYRSTADRMIHARLIVIGKSIESSIQSSLALGLSFADLGMLPDLMERERGANDLIRGIEVFDASGSTLYSTDSLRAGRRVPQPWLSAVRRADDGSWSVEHGAESAVGISIKNSFGMTVGYLALRYSSLKIDQSAQVVARELAVIAIAVFAGAAALASLAMIVVMRQLDQQLRSVEAALHNPAVGLATDTLSKGMFGPAFVRFFATMRAAETQIAAVRSKLLRGVTR